MTHTALKIIRRTLLAVFILGYLAGHAHASTGAMLLTNSTPTKQQARSAIRRFWQSNGFPVRYVVRCKRDPAHGRTTCIDAVIVSACSHGKCADATMFGKDSAVIRDGRVRVIVGPGSVAVPTTIINA